MRKSGFRDWARHKKFLEYSFSNPGQTSGISVSYFFMLAGTAGLGNWRGSWQERMRDRHISRVVPGVIRVSLQGSFLSRAGIIPVSFAVSFQGGIMSFGITWFEVRSFR